MNASFVLKLMAKGVMIILMLFYMNIIFKAPVLSAFSVLYYGKSKKPNGNWPKHSQS